MSGQSTVTSLEPKRSKVHKLSRAEKSQKIRESLFEAAAKVVGEHGYSNAMVAMITARAGVAQGTFYNYFESRQDLFDQLLPQIGRSMLDFVKERSKGAATEMDREERAFRAFFEYLKEHPEFYRILYEAETFAPRAFQRHMDFVAERYTDVLRRARDRGEIRDHDDRQLQAVAFVLMGARHYLCMRYARDNGSATDLPEAIVSTYMDLLRFGLYA